MKMNGNHLSTWEQEEYVLSRNTAGHLDGYLSTTRHLEECEACTSAVAQLEQGIALYRDSATEWSAACLETRLQHPPKTAPSARPSTMPPTMSTMRWAMAAVLLVLALLPLYFLTSHHPAQLANHDPAPATTTAQSPSLTDDALLQEVDQQVSESVPDSMESLTHLVTTTSNATPEAKSGSGSGQRVETN